MVKQLITLLFLTSPYTFSQSGDSLLSGTQYPPVDSITTSIPDILPGQDSLSTPLITEKPDTISPIQGQPLTSTSTIIERQTFLFTNYRYTGDLLRSFPLNFIKDQGFIGQPNESFIYGIGNNGVSYLRDGVLWNNRFTNSLDLNHMQSEDIDSIEIVPSPRGFLYGPYNNPVTVNFISRDFSSPEPYSRLKYYEGPSGEAMIDGLFNANIFKRWNIGLQVTNRKFDSTYTNSEFSTWQINSKLKYFLSNSVNISAYYGYVDSRVGLNDGVDVDSISRITSDINSILYEPLRAPVVSPNQKLETLQHNFVLRTLAKPFDKSILDLSLYYKYNLDELGNGPVTMYNKLEAETYGGSLSYDHKESEYLGLQLGAGYEKNESLVERIVDLPSEYKYNYLSAFGILYISLFDSVLQPSAFYKIERRDFESDDLNNSGYGIDLKISPLRSMNFYAGFSSHTQIFDEATEVYEIGGSYLTEVLKLEIKYFNIGDFVPYTPRLYSLLLRGAEIDYPIHFATGIGFSARFKIGLILFEVNYSKYLDYNELLGIPEDQFVGGVYLNDLFFHDNLDLKAGFKFYYTGKILSSEDPLYSAAIVEPTNKLDFTLAGEIKKLAIFYFIWENILNKQYYITSYYPMPESNLRFGIAWELFN